MNEHDEIKRMIGVYTKSIDGADVELGATIWVTTPDASFIEPRGSEHGWKEISEGFYGKVMGETFSARKLRVTGEPSVKIFGNSAVVEFDWAFQATFRSNQRPLNTNGRETQVYVKFPEMGWRLVHVHYSGPPITEAGAGF